MPSPRAARPAQRAHYLQFGPIFRRVRAQSVGGEPAVRGISLEQGCAVPTFPAGRRCGISHRSMQE